MVDWKNIELVYGNNTLEHIAKHRVSLSEVHNVLDGYFDYFRTSPYEARTEAFSPFAIAGLKEIPKAGAPVVVTETAKPVTIPAVSPT